MTKTKSVGVTGRFGPRYGVSVRRRIREVEEGLRTPHVCPNCQAKKVKRVSAGIWICRKCNLKFSGGAYRPSLTREKKKAPVEETEVVKDV
jgi:large subunit ribosomal protein L37Ae